MESLGTEGITPPVYPQIYFHESSVHCVPQIAHELTIATTKWRTAMDFAEAFDNANSRVFET